MSKSQSSNVRTLPRWMVATGSVLIAGHLLAVVLLALSARSGPWIPPMQFLPPSPSEGPKFATIISAKTGEYYLHPLGMSHTYHFESNKVAEPAVKFEVILKDKNGQALQTLKFPEDDVNFWVHHRQQLLATGLGNDIPVPQQELQSPEVIGGDAQQVEKKDYWLLADEIRRLLTRKVIHDAFVVVDSPEQLLNGKAADKNDKELNLSKINAFYPLRAQPEEVARLTEQGLLSAPYFVQGDSLTAVRSDIPVVAGVRFYRVRPDKLEHLQQLETLGTPFIFAGDDSPSKQHLYRLAVREDQKGQVGAVVGPRAAFGVARPSPMSLILAQSYLRHLCRQHGAYSAELIRHSRQPVLPSYMYFQQEQQLPPVAFAEIVAHFGDLKRDFEEGTR